MTKHANLSIFIPNAGCQNRCIFCDQRVVSGETRQPSPKDVERVCKEQLPWPIEASETEIAFFGGSFTALKRNYMVSLLDAAQPFVLEGRAKGIRVSTRPDAIDVETLLILKTYGVTSIELGAQSTDDMVLLDNQRSHTRADIINAASEIKKSGFSLGLQMMVGMYAEDDSEKAALKTAVDFIGLKPDTVRIYPTTVLRHTKLEYLYHIGAYEPLPLQTAVDITGKLLLLFDKNDIIVIRAGLHSDETLRENIVAGPHHPAFGELAMASAYRSILDTKFKRTKKGDYNVYVAKGRRSAAAGQRRSNIKYFQERGFQLTIRESEQLGRFEVKTARKEPEEE
ncbi:MAG: radical SAM protein [Oscillospiraceae bacterium]|nr:radical SAM protein [Oscillospiraceae bacterium]